MTSQREHDLSKRPLDAPALTFDIPDLVAQIKQEETWQKGQRNAMTLFKGRGLRVVLVAMHAKTSTASHRTNSPISLQVIEGTLKFRTDAEVLNLEKGQLLTLQGGIPHTVEAQEESVFLLTLATEMSHPAEG